MSVTMGHANLIPARRPAQQLWPTRWAAVTLIALALLPAAAVGQTLTGVPVEYRLSFPEAEHRWLRVQVVFRDLNRGKLRLMMSSASPGRYARHEFAKNLIDLEIVDGRGRALAFTQPATQQWEIAAHDGMVQVTYHLFGDRLDGTYLAVDSTHAHINMPATLVWARGLEDRPVRVTFERPADTSWRVATQLYSTDDPLVFTAPNLQYLLDSPAEFSDFTLRTFQATDPSDRSYRPTFRVAVHHDGDDLSVDAYARAVEAVVNEAVTVFGEFPRFETDTYTFIADYLPYASADAMEHRNSTVLTSSRQLARPAQRARLLFSVAHEFFHAWNVERSRPRSLEPFDFTGANVSGELWLAEGFTNYYAEMIMHRAGLADLARTLRGFSGTINAVVLSPGRQYRSAVEMSRLAAFTDAATAIDRTNWGNTFISYYTWGEAIALGLDLTLRIRSYGMLTLDDYIRALWVRFGRPGGAVPGIVDEPYTLSDAREILAEVTSDRPFAEEFFARYIEGRDVVDYAALLEEAGVLLRKRSPGVAWLGDESFGTEMRVTEPTRNGSPLHAAGVDRDDVLLMLDRQRVLTRADVDRVVAARQPGDTIAIGFLRRGRPVESVVTLVECPRLELVALESTGAALTPDQHAFREAWLGSWWN